MVVVLESGWFSVVVSESALPSVVVEREEWREGVAVSLGVEEVSMFEMGFGELDEVWWCCGDLLEELAVLGVGIGGKALRDLSPLSRVVPHKFHAAQSRVVQIQPR